MLKAKVNPISICNLRQGSSQSIIYTIPDEFLMWVWFDKYIVRHDAMDTFSSLNDIFEVPSINTLFSKSKKFRHQDDFRGTAQRFFKMSFKTSKFKLKYENNEVSVISNVSDCNKLIKRLKGFFVKLQPDHVELFRKFEYNSLVQDEEKNSYVLYGPLSYVNHSCSAVMRISPPVRGLVYQEVKLEMPFYIECVNDSVMPVEECRTIKSIVSGSDVDVNQQALITERTLAEKNDLNPFGKTYRLTGMEFINVCDNAAEEGKEFYIRYSNYIPCTWFKCRCEPEQYCCQYDFRFLENKRKQSFKEPCSKRIRR